MACDDFQDVLDELARGGLVDASAEREARDHAAGCAACGEYAGAAVVLSEALAAWAREDGRAEAPPRVAAAAMAAFRETRGPRTAMPLFLGISTAAAVLLAGFLATYHASVPASLPAAAVAPAGEPEEGFVPLASADPLEDEDGGAVMRVSLPASALTSLGLPGGDGASPEIVEAEVVVGEDGIARAARLVDVD
jgi:hypothetical protein